MERLYEIHHQKIWKRLGFVSLREYCLAELGYDTHEVHSIFISLGIIVPSDRLRGDTLEMQNRIDVLKEWRRKKARALAIPAYRILPNETLLAIASENPHDLTMLKEVKGMGPARMGSFGKEVLKILSSMR